MQMQMTLPKVDKQKTKEAVEEVMEVYRMYTYQVSLDRLPTITADYSMMPRSFTGTTNSSTEDAAIANIEYDQERLKYMDWVHQALNRLPARERYIIIKLYVEEGLYDYEIYSEMHMSERQFYRMKNKVIIRMAMALKVEVYQ